MIRVKVRAGVRTRIKVRVRVRTRVNVRVRVRIRVNVRVRVHFTNEFLIFPRMTKMEMITMMTTRTRMSTRKTLETRRNCNHRLGRLQRSEEGKQNKWTPTMTTEMVEGNDDVDSFYCKITFVFSEGKITASSIYSYFSHFRLKNYSRLEMMGYGNSV